MIGLLHPQVTSHRVTAGKCPSGIIWSPTLQPWLCRDFLQETHLLMRSPSGVPPMGTWFSR